MLIQNAIKITENHPEEFFLVSEHQHHYNSYKFKSGESVAVDGGTAYTRRSFSTKSNYGTDWMEWCLDSEEPFYTIKNRLLWGTRGKDGKQQLKYVRLVTCETDHLENILKELVWRKNGSEVRQIYIDVIEDILSDRKFVE